LVGTKYKYDTQAVERGADDYLTVIYPPFLIFFGRMNDGLLHLRPLAK